MLDWYSFIFVCLLVCFSPFSALPSVLCLSYLLHAFVHVQCLLCASGVAGLMISTCLWRCASCQPFYYLPSAQVDVFIDYLLDD